MSTEEREEMRRRVKPLYEKFLQLRKTQVNPSLEEKKMRNKQLRELHEALAEEEKRYYISEIENILKERGAGNGR